jgi:thiamine pyrophosphate-dependent acetolactate synthase large subunit-like protein
MLGASKAITLHPCSEVVSLEGTTHRNATALMIKSPDGIVPVMKRALDTSGPVIIGVHVDYRDNPTLFENVDTRAIH